MPYKSQAQVRYMHAKHPGIAKEWDGKYGVPTSLPKKRANKAPKRLNPRKRKPGNEPANRQYF